MDKTNIWLLSHPSMNYLSNAIIKFCKSQMLNLCSSKENDESNVPIRSIEYKDIIHWKKFPDQWPNLFIDKVKNLAGKDIIFLASLHTPEVIFEQISIIYIIPKYLARSFTVIIPYFPTATMERVDTEGQVATAKTLATLVSAIPLTARGPAKIIIYDIHALQERFYFSEKVIPRLETAIPLLLKTLDTIQDKEDISIVFPDEGAYKRFHLAFPNPPYTVDRLITCIKVRVGLTERRVTIKEGNPKGRHCVIVDDLVMTGGTIKECARMLYKMGASGVSAYVTHAVFPQNSWQLFATEGEGRLPESMGEPYFKYFWITDSIPYARTIANNHPFVLLPLAEVISETLLGYDLCIA